jgi:hypothetical protein
MATPGRAAQLDTAGFWAQLTGQYDVLQSHCQANDSNDWIGHFYELVSFEVNEQGLNEGHEFDASGTVPTSNLEAVLSSKARLHDHLRLENIEFVNGSQLTGHLKGSIVTYSFNFSQEPARSIQIHRRYESQFRLEWLPGRPQIFRYVVECDDLIQKARH